MKRSVFHIYSYVKKDAYEYLFSSFKVFGVIMLVISVIKILTYYFSGNPEENFYQNWLGVYLIGALVFGVNLFHEISKDSTRTTFLSIPMSTAEKTIAKFIMLAICYQVMMIVLYIVSYYFVFLVDLTLGINVMEPLFPDMGWPFFYSFHISLILGSLFAFGSIKFNNFSFPKIVIWLVFFAIGVSIIMIVTAIALFPELREFILQSIIGNEELEGFQLLSNSASLEDSWPWKTARFVWYFLLIPVLWIMIFLHIRDKEAS